MAELSDLVIDRLYRDVGRRVRDARSAVRMTQAQLAGRVGVTRSSIANLEAGRQRIPLHLLLWIAEALDTRPEKLLPSGPSFGDIVTIPDVSQHLAEAPNSARDFVHGALAHLPATPGKEA